MPFFPTPSHSAPRSFSRLSGPRDALKSRGSGRTAGPGAAEDGDRKLRSAVEQSQRRGWQPCPDKAGLVQPDICVLLLQGLPRGHKTVSGVP